LNKRVSNNWNFPLSSEQKEWARGWLEKDQEYLKHSARFGSPLVQRIAAFILEIAEGDQEKPKE